MTRRLLTIRAPSPLVRELCRRIELRSRKTVAYDAGVGYQYLSDIRSGRLADPGIVRLEKVADALGYDIVLRPKPGQE